MEKMTVEQVVLEELEEHDINKAIIKGKEKSVKTVNKAYRALQLVKMNIKTNSYKFCKRCFDISVGVVGIIMLLPIMLIVKIANLTQGDTAPLFLKQVRIGKDGKAITIYKIRSMVPNAEKKLEELMEKDPAIKEEYLKNKKLKNDPRITKVGKFIRKTSIDEFGQFINILIGNMTVVGPRPYLPREKEDMGIYYEDVIKCKPGLTGLWQVEGRSDIGFVNRCRLDRFYNNHKSFRFDMLIFFKTFTSVLHSKGAR